MDGTPLDLLQGTVDVLILKTLSWGALHGFGVSKWIGGERKAFCISMTPRSIKVFTGSSARLARSEWGWSESNRRAKYTS